MVRGTAEMDQLMWSLVTLCSLKYPTDMGALVLKLHVSRKKNICVAQKWDVLCEMSTLENAIFLKKAWNPRFYLWNTMKVRN